MSIRIVNRWNANLVVYESEEATIRLALEVATQAGADLVGANLGGADLGGANLRGADLRDANLGGADLGGANLGGADLGDADLVGANLVGANLVGANLVGADLGGANLGDADLRDADLRDADLRGANLRGANLVGADLVDADLVGADLTSIRDDVWGLLSAAPAEAKGLRDALAAGRVNGSVYGGDCACLVGTVANIRQKSYLELGALKPNAGRPAEAFAMSISEGDTPETSQVAALLVEWIDQWLHNMRATFGTATL